jgi:hypothetical protein
MTLRLALALGVACQLIVTARASAQLPCPGDCDDDGMVAVAEVVLGVGIVLGRESAAACSYYACASSDCAGIALLVAGVDSALRGCRLAPTPTQTLPPAVTTSSPSATATVVVEPPTWTPAPTPTRNPDPIIAGLDDVVAAQCTWNSPGPFRMGAWAAEDGYRILCDAAHGHDSDAALVRYANSAAAALAFEEGSQPGEATQFNGLPAAYWETPFRLDGANRYLVWQLGCWIVTAHNFDDTHFQISRHPIPFSNAILATVGDLLLERCGQQHAAGGSGYAIAREPQ